jgi:hypothetical protein
MLKKRPENFSGFFDFSFFLCFHIGMEKFLEKIQTEIESKMLACVRGESIVKPFNQIYEEVREKPAKKVTNEKRVGKIYSR